MRPISPSNSPHRENVAIRHEPYPPEVLAQLLTARDVARIARISRSWLYALRNPRSAYYDPAMPPPIRLGQRSVRWRLASILAWLDSKSETEAKGAVK